MKRILCIFLIPTILVSGAVTVWADQSRVFSLQHRSAGELLPLLEPLLNEGARLSGSGQKLIVRGTEEDIELVSGLVVQLDNQAPQFMIQVRQGHATNRTPTSGKILGTTPAGTTSRSGGRTFSNSRTTITQGLRIEEGQRAFLQVGRDEPFTTDVRAFAGDIFGYGEHVDYRKVVTGFWVQPELRGERVRLKIVPAMQNLSGDQRRKVIEFQKSSTTVQVPPGTWINLARSLSDSGEVGRAMLTYKAGSRDELREIWIKVDRLEETR